MRNRPQKTNQTSLICPECGNVFTIMRGSQQQRSLYHLKKLYCFKCKKEINHIEVKDLDMLMAELNIKYPDLTEEENKVYQLIKKRGE